MLVGFYINPAPLSRSFFKKSLSKYVGLRKIRDNAPESSLQAFYDLLGCHTIDIVSRSIMGFPVSIVCDDVGRFVESPRPSLFVFDGSPEDDEKDPLDVLVGGIFICGPADDVGNLTDIPAPVASYLCLCIRGYAHDAFISPCAVVHTQPLRGV